MSNIDYEGLYLQYRKFLWKICTRISSSNTKFDMDDLMQMAYLGLHKAADTYSEYEGASFTHYLALCVKWAIIRELANYGYVVRVPMHINDQIQRYKNAKGELTHELLRDPLPHEIAQRMQIPTRDISDIERAVNLRSVTSLDAPIGDDGDNSLVDVLADTDAEDIYTSTERSMFRGQLWAAARCCLCDDLFGIISDYFRSGINFSKQAEIRGKQRQFLNEKYKTALNRLRRNKEIQQLAKDCGYACESGRHVTLTEWKYTFTSTVEKEVLLREERANRHTPRKGGILCLEKPNLIPK